MSEVALNVFYSACLFFGAGIGGRFLLRGSEPPDWIKAVVLTFIGVGAITLFISILVLIWI